MPQIQPGVYRPQRTVDISKTDEPVKSPGDPNAWVSRPTWTPKDGAARNAELEKARIEALEDYQKRLAEQHPLAERCSALEQETRHLKERLARLEKTVTEVLTGGK